MDYSKEYKSFINSHYLYDGVRITFGVALPAVVLNYFNWLSVGIVVSLGAMCATIPDNPGPIQHRRNAMAACIIVVFFVSMITGFVVPYPFLLGLLIFIFCFIFSMMGVFGGRANSVGVAALLIMILNINRHNEGWEVVINSLYILAGGIWYMTLSLVLYSFRPYKLAQQALGDFILSIADYMRTRGSFYEENVNLEDVHQQVLEQQISIDEKQNLIREILFKSRDIVKESTAVGRTLLMIFLDVSDLFERAMTTYQNYEALHTYFDGTDILPKYQQLILELSGELDTIGLAVKSGKSSEEMNELPIHLEETQSYLEHFIETNRTAENVGGFISLRHILNSIKDIARRIHTLHLYTSYDKELVETIPTQLDYDQFITHQEFDSKILKDNLSFESDTFRHALRVSVATLVGYLVSLFFPLGHGYWILLTIIVILKPAYSLTKKRNYERLLGTIFGGLLGIVILYFIKDKTALFFIMLFLMIGTYSLLRTKYMISVLLMTPYILLLFHLLNTGKTSTLILDRVLDTAIGSAIAFVANLLLLPVWEQEHIDRYMTQAMEDNIAYFKAISAAYVGKQVSLMEYKLSRKNAFVALANLSDALTRMLSEPKRKQKNNQLIHQFVVISQTLTSHIATLSYYGPSLSAKYQSQDFAPIINDTVLQLEEAKENINKSNKDSGIDETIERYKLDKRVRTLIEKRRAELQQGQTHTETRKTLSEFKSIVDQFNFISNIAKDLRKISRQL